MSFKNNKTLMLSGISFSVLLSAIAGNVIAQELKLTKTERIKSESDENATTLKPIVITARKTPEDLLKVPESVTVVSPSSIQEAPFESGRAIANASPNVQWERTTPATKFFSIRGISSLGAPQNFNDGTISYNVDGVPTSMLSASNALIDIDHVEVLRGPQGTLWGANSLGGAINVVTNEPDGPSELSVRSEIGSNSYRMGEAIIGGNIIPDAVDGRIAVRLSGQNGDIDSLFTDDLGKDRNVAVRGGLRFNGLDNTTITWTGSYLNDRGNAPFFVVRDASSFPASGLGSEPFNQTRSGGTTLKVEHEFDNFKLTSISAYQNNWMDIHGDADDKLLADRLGFPIGSFGKTIDKENIYSEELRLSSLDGDPLRWVVGVSAVHSDYSRTCWTCLPTTGTKAAIDTTNLGLFGDVSIPFAERWEVSAGARLNHDTIKETYTNAAGIPGFAGTSSTSETYPSGRLALAYDWSDEVRTYVSVARGHATKVYSNLPTVIGGVVPDAFPAANAWTYEAGVKAKVLDDRVQIEATVFHNDVRNGLLAYLDPLALAFKQTYQDYQTDGFEIQARAEVTDELSLSGGVGYTHSKLGKNGAAINLVSGNPVPNTPRWTVNAGFQYEVPAEALNLPGTFSANLGYQYTASRAADAERTFDLKPYQTVDARLGWKDAASDLELYAFGRNLFDKRYETFGANVLGVQTVSVGMGRVVGVGVSKKF